MNTILILIMLTNLQRTTPLLVDTVLTTRAEERAKYLCEHNQWSHSSWRDSFKGYKDTYIGENLGEGFKDVYSLNEALMKSPSHKANIVSTRYKYIGVGQACGIYVELFRS